MHANHINSLNDSIQGLVHRVRLLENQLDIKLKRDKRKSEFKVEKKNQNYEKAFQIALELKAKYMIQILPKLKEADYQLISSSKFENAIDVLFNDLDEVVNYIHILLIFINNVIKYCQLTLHPDLQNKIIANCMEILSLRDEYCINDNDIELINIIVNSLNQQQHKNKMNE